MSGAVLSLAAFVGHLAACAQQYPVIREAGQRVMAHAVAESALRPFAIHDNTTRQSFAPETAAEAIAVADRLVRAGHSIDAGLMQVNSANWPAYGLTVESAFDPQANICAGARILGEAFAIERRAACRYNTGRPDCSNGYPEMVQRAAAILRIPADAVSQAPALPPEAKESAPALCAPAWDAWALASCTAAASASSKQEKTSEHN
jgi:type IV secretion system protein VirB1